MNEQYEKWSEMAPLGLTFIGLGVSLVGEAIIRKGHGKPFWKWFFLGTLALVVLNSGMSIFGDAVKARALYEMSLKKGE
ncbi:MAG: hypothetical protein HC915_07135 [Anaerolineae bacterium]|nr:hypothetical protein [Anaerolineae bacterium]